MYCSVVVVIVVVVYLSIYLSVYLQVWTRSYSARLRQFFKLTVTSKTKQFCETSSIFELDNVKDETILRGFSDFRSWQQQKQSNSERQEWKVECRADGLVPKRFAIFPVHVSKVLRLPQKSEARLYKTHAKSSSQTWKSDAPKCNPSQEISGLTS